MNESILQVSKQPRVDADIRDITNKYESSKMSRSFSSSSQVQLKSVDIKESNKAFNGPHKMRVYESITDSITDAFQKKEKPSCFMQRWQASVVESIDFNTQPRGVDKKELDDALNCALYAEDVHKHCLKTELDFHPD